MSEPLFEIDDLHVTSAATGGDPAEDVLRGVSLTVWPGEVHAVVGPDGSDASALAPILLGSPRHRVTRGRIRLRGDDITDWGTDVRAKAGLFLAFREPREIGGVSLLTLLGQAIGARTGPERSVIELRGTVNRAATEWADRLAIDPSSVERHVNVGASAPERRRNEILQLAVLEPVMAVLDETDPDLDSEALATMAAAVAAVRAERPSLGTLAIARDQRLVDHLQPDRVHVLVDGRIVASGGPELARRLENEGYESIR
jgi:Fe-S cluster assembly ATP-binding protein